MRWGQGEPRLKTAQARRGGRDGSGDVSEAREEGRGRGKRVGGAEPGGGSGVGPALCSAARPGGPRAEAAPSSRPKPAEQRLRAARVRLPRRLIWTRANSPKGRCGRPGPSASRACLCNVGPGLVQGTAAASLSITNSQSLLRLTSIESVMPSSHLILCRPLLLPPIPPSIEIGTFPISGTLETETLASRPR